VLFFPQLYGRGTHRNGDMIEPVQTSRA
jgi:hypothetical protein